MYRFESFKKILTPKRTVSIKRTGFKIFQRFLLNVLYDLKIGGLNSLTYCPYNRNHRVGLTISIVYFKDCIYCKSNDFERENSLF